MSVLPGPLGSSLRERVLEILRICPLWRKPRLWLAAYEVRRELSDVTNEQVGRALSALKRRGKATSRRYGWRQYWRIR